MERTHTHLKRLAREPRRRTLTGVRNAARAALMNMASPIMESYLRGLVRPEEWGFASALNSIVWRMPWSESTAGGGWRVGQYQMPFLIAGTLYTMVVAFFYPVFRSVRATGSAAAAEPGNAA